MPLLRSVLLVALFVAFQAVQAAPAPTVTAATSRPTCTITQAGANVDDTPAIVAAIAKCNSNATILFQKGVTYNSFTPVQFAMGSNVNIQLLGNINLPSTIPAVQTMVTSKNYKSGWYLVSGQNISLIGPSSGSGGIINSFGQQWWDAVQQTSRPGLFAWKVNNGTIRSITITKPIGKSFNVAGNGNIIEKVTIDAKSTTSAFPFNTDAFDVGGDGNLIQDSISCTGSHGVSIAAKGGGVVVKNILIQDIAFKDSLYGARYKASAGGIGIASNLVYDRISVNNVTFPIYVTQNYYDQSQSAPPPSNTSVTIQGLSFSNFIGTINPHKPGDGSCISDPCWYNVNGVDGTQSIIFDRLYANTVTGLHVKTIAVVPQALALPKVMCNATVTTGDVGMKCWDGLYIPTLSGL